MAAAVMTAAVKSVPIFCVANEMTVDAETTMEAEDTATETPMRPWIDEAGKVTAAAPAAAMMERVIVQPRYTHIHEADAQSTDKQDRLESIDGL